MNLGTQKLIETLMVTVMKGLNLDPEAVKAQIGQIGANVSSFAATQKRIEQKLDLLLTERGLEYVETIERGNGAAEPATGSEQGVATVVGGNHGVAGVARPRDEFAADAEARN